MKEQIGQTISKAYSKRKLSKLYGLIMVSFVSAAILVVHYLSTSLLLKAVLIGGLAFVLIVIVRYINQRVSLLSQFNWISMLAVFIAAIMINQILPQTDSDNNTFFVESSIRITLVESRNPDSKASEVWISTVKGSDSFSQLFSQEMPAGWEIRNGSLLSFSPGSVITVPVPADEVSFEFVMHPWSGMIEIHDGNKTAIIDLYHPEGSSWTYEVVGNRIDRFPWAALIQRVLISILLITAALLFIIITKNLPERQIIESTISKIIGSGAAVVRWCIRKHPGQWEVLSMPIGNISLRRIIFLTAASLSSSLAISVSVGSGRNPDNTVLLVVFSMSLGFSILLYSSLSHLTARQNLKIPRTLCIGACSLSILLLMVLTPIVFSRFPDSEIMIEVADTRNNNSKASEVWLTALVINGKNLDLREVPITENGWQYKQGYLYSSNPGIPLKLVLPAGNSEMIFLTHGWSGIALIHDNDKLVELDLYQDAGGVVSYPVRAAEEIKINQLNKVAFLFCGFISLSFLLLLLFMLFRTHPQVFGIIIALAFICMFPPGIRYQNHGIYVVRLLSFVAAGLVFGKEYRAVQEKGIISFFTSVHGVVCAIIINAIIAFQFYADSTFFNQARLMLSTYTIAFNLLFILLLIPLEILIFHGISSVSEYLHKQRPVEISLRKKAAAAAILFLIFTSVWSIFLYGFYPGLLSADSVSQILQANDTWPLTDAHPVYHTLLIRWILSLWDSPAAVVIFQILLLSTVSTALFHYFYRCGIPWSLIIRFALIFSLLPTNGILVVTLWKDIPFSASFMWLTLLLLQYAEKPERIKHFFFIIQFIIASLMVALIRHNGLYSIVAMLGALAVISLIKKRFALLPSIIIIASAIVLLRGPVFSSIGVKPGDIAGSAAATPFIDLVGLALEDFDLTSEAEELIYDLAPRDVWETFYSPYNANNITHNPYFNRDIGAILVQKAGTGNVLRMYLENFFTYPANLVYIRLRSANLLWDIRMPPGAYNYRFTLNSDQNPDIRNVDRRPNQVGDLLSSYLQISTSNSITDTLFWRPGTSLAAILILILYWISRKRWQVFPAVIPFFANILVLLLVVHYQDYRYFYFMLLVLFPFLLYSFLLPSANGKTRCLKSCSAHHRNRGGEPKAMRGLSFPTDIPSQREKCQNEQHSS